jgi:ComF family protein
VDPVLSLVFPVACPACGLPLDRPSRGPLCEPCWTQLPRHRDSACDCGAPLPNPDLDLCGRCRRGLADFDRGASLGPYTGALRVAIHQLKYTGKRRAAKRLAEQMSRLAPVQRVLLGEPLLIPVPLHPGRATARGFNQAALLAAALAKPRGLRVLEGLVRVRDTPPQTGRSAAARRRNVAGAFQATERLRDRDVVLVDDVLTTGATARACARALRRAGARRVGLLTVARVI